MTNYPNKYPLVYAIDLKKTKKLIGHISLSTIAEGIEIVYAIATEYQNNGYASEIIEPFSKWAKETLGMKRIYGIVKVNNIHSWKILEKNGYKLKKEKNRIWYDNGEFLTKIYTY